MGKSLIKNYPYIMVVPVLLLYFTFFILPTLLGVYFSFTAWDIFSSRFIGLDNFINFFKNPDLGLILKNTVVFAVITTVLKVGLGLLLAVFLNQKLKTTNFLRTVFFIPVILSPVAVGLLFTALLHPETGIVNIFFRTVGLNFLSVAWLENIHTALYSVSAIEVWKYTGLTMIIFLAGLQTISREYYEASEIDGASRRQKFINITLPLIMPSFNNALVLNIIGGLGVFDIIYATTRGGPGGATEVLNTLVYRDFTMSWYGEAAAATMILAALVGIIALSAFRVLRRKEVEL